MYTVKESVEPENTSANESINMILTNNKKIHIVTSGFISS